MIKIDDDNKIVWCNDTLVDWNNSFKEISDPLAKKLYYLARVGFGWRLVDYWQKDIPFRSWDHTKKNELMLALLNGYELKAEPKKYYWRKKKEHRTEWERCIYVNVTFTNAVIADIKNYATKLTEPDARKLLKDDFDMFEKVEEE